MSKPRRRHTAEQKAELLRQHVAEKKPVSEVCNEAAIQPSLFYTWQRELLAGAHTVFSTRRAPSRENELEAKISRLEARVARKDQIIAEVTEEYVTLKKKTWGSLNGAWIPHDRRDEVVDFVNTISTKTRLPVQQVVEWCGLARGKFYDWRKRYGKVNEHNGLVPRDHWIEDWERQRVIDYFDCHPLDGYRRLTFMMLDEDVVALSPSTTYRVLSKAGRLDRWNGKPSKKGTGFVQPLRPHQHWHTDISYLNLGGTFYYLCSFLDGASRAVVHWEIRESMTEADVECILERAKELYPDARPRIISDNGPQYIAKDFKTFIRISGMTHVRTAPYYPQSNGKIERWHKTIKSDALRPANPLSLEEARRLMERFVAYYNGVRLHSAIGYIAPLDFMAGKAPEIWSERDRKLEQAREARRERRSNKVPA